MDEQTVGRFSERLERVSDRQREHEQKCASRNEKDAERFARLEVAVGRNTKLLWAVVFGIVGLALKGAFLG